MSPAYRIASALLVLALAATAGAYPKDPTNDTEFIQQSIHADTAEIKMAELALKASSSDEVKKFARMMIADHTKHRKESSRLAKALMFSVAEGTTKEDQEILAKLAKLTGKDFDSAYAKAQVVAHEKVLKLNEMWSRDGETQPVRESAKATAKVVRHHLEMAKKLDGGSDR